MSFQKRKRTDFTLKEKKEIIDAAKKEPNRSKLAREISKKWGVEVKRTTVKGILSQKDTIEAAIKAGVPSERMKLTQAHDPKLHERVFMWLKQARKQNLPVSGDLIEEEVLCTEEPVKSEDDDITVEEDVVSFEEAQRAWSTVRKFMQERSGKPGVMQACDRLDNEMHVIRQKKMLQPTILVDSSNEK